MNSNTTAVWVVYRNTDLTEGRGLEYPWLVCKSKATALRKAQKNHVQGSNCPIREVFLKSIHGVQHIPLHFVPIIEPTPEDTLEDEKRSKVDHLLSRLTDAGFSDEDIELIVELRNKEA